MSAHADHVVQRYKACFPDTDRTEIAAHQYFVDMLDDKGHMERIAVNVCNIHITKKIVAYMLACGSWE